MVCNLFATNGPTQDGRGGVLVIDAARRVSAQHLGHSQLELLARGRWSRAYRTSGVRSDHVIRVGDANQCLGSYQRDLWAGHWWSATGLVPNVIATGTVAMPRGEDVAFCISEFRGGEPIEASSGGAVELVADLLHQLGELELPGLGFGPWSAQGGRADHSTWADWLAASAQESASQISRAQLASADTLHRWMRELSRGLADLPNVRAAVHRDLGAGNVLVDRRNAASAVSAQDRRLSVIDWGNSVAGDSFYDAAHLLFWDPWHPLLHDALKALDLDRDYRVGTYSIHIGLEQLAFHATTHSNLRQSRGVIARVDSLLGRH